MDRIKLDAKPRTMLGKKVRFMRRTGIIPVNVFGHNVSSRAMNLILPRVVSGQHQFSFSPSGKGSSCGR